MAAESTTLKENKLTTSVDPDSANAAIKTGGTLGMAAIASFRPNHLTEDAFISRVVEADGSSNEGIECSMKTRVPKTPPPSALDISRQIRRVPNKPPPPSALDISSRLGPPLRPSCVGYKPKAINHRATRDKLETQNRRDAESAAAQQEPMNETPPKKKHTSRMPTKRTKTRKAETGSPKTEHRSGTPTKRTSKQATHLPAPSSRGGGNVVSTDPLPLAAGTSAFLVSPATGSTDNTERHLPPRPNPRHVRVARKPPCKRPSSEKSDGDDDDETDSEIAPPPLKKIRPYTASSSEKSDGDDDDETSKQATQLPAPSPRGGGGIVVSTIPLPLAAGTSAFLVSPATGSTDKTSPDTPGDDDDDDDETRPYTASSSEKSDGDDDDETTSPDTSDDDGDDETARSGGMPTVTGTPPSGPRPCTTMSLPVEGVDDMHGVNPKMIFGWKDSVSNKIRLPMDGERRVPGHFR